MSCISFYSAQTAWPQNYGGKRGDRYFASHVPFTKYLGYRLYPTDLLVKKENITGGYLTTDSVLQFIHIYDFNGVPAPTNPNAGTVIFSPFSYNKCLKAAIGIIRHDDDSNVNTNLNRGAIFRNGNRYLFLLSSNKVNHSAINEVVCAEQEGDHVYIRSIAKPYLQSIDFLGYMEHEDFSRLIDCLLSQYTYQTNL
jgi:hypothetical protein